MSTFKYRDTRNIRNRKDYQLDTRASCAIMTCQARGPAQEVKVKQSWRSIGSEYKYQRKEEYNEGIRNISNLSIPTRG